MKAVLVLLLALQAVAGEPEKTHVPAEKGNEGSGSPSTDQTHWSLRPVSRPTPPKIQTPKWKERNPIDSFVLAKLAESKLSPSPEAPRRVLIRRLYYDLIGLPPTPDEVRAFEQDKAKNAYEKVVEHLLASPRYGERWAQHWLDAVRFAETHGFEMNQPRNTAWRYRDYVIDAFNTDKPYDRFVLEQFAGDVLGEDAATGFLVAGPWDQVKSPDPVLTATQRADELHDMVSTTGSAFLGLTVGCARCHNHKFDPIPQTDYYALKASLAGVQHGERKLHTAEAAAREAQAEQAKKELAALETKFIRFEPIAHTGRILRFEPEPVFGSRLAENLKPGLQARYPEGTGRGERDDPGDLDRLPNLSGSFLCFSNSANTDVFAFEPGVTGRFRVWLSWACASEANAEDARFVLDRDGDLTTTTDQAEIARVDQQQFADGTGKHSDKRLWSGFRDAGVWELSRSNRIVLRSGAKASVVTIGTLGLSEEPLTETLDIRASGAGGGDLGPAESTSPAPAIDQAPHGTSCFLRTPVNARRNVEHFAAVKAKRLRFTVDRTIDGEPCIDELEVYTEGPSSANVALASTGTKASASGVYPNSELHKLEHINDGKYGNSRSWISNERGKGWVELEFPNEVTIDRVVWGRDRDQQFSDRLATEYRIEVSTAAGPAAWQVVASSKDRVPYRNGRGPSPDFNTMGLSETDATDLKELVAQRKKLDARIRELTAAPMAYAGMLTEKPEPTYRLQRGDPMQKREVVEPGVLTAVPVALRKSATNGSLTDDQARRLALAKWIVDPANPLPSRVMVNRLWQHHFGEGIVSTPSDFGKKGAKPSHLELLDWLASEFVVPRTLVGKNEPTPPAWSIKHIHRLIVTSTTYRQDSTARPQCMAVDAGSRLLWRFPPQRLEAEPLRDSILALSGKLDLRAGGPGFSPFEPNDNYVRVYNPRKEFGPPEWRRMVYMTKVRMQQDSTFGAFDCPDGGQIAPKRMRSTTPLQALNLLNSNFLVQQAGYFAERLEQEAGKASEAQVRRAFDLVYNRAPDRQELKVAQTLISQHGLAMFCRALFNSNEFIFVE